MNKDKIKYNDLSKPLKFAIIVTYIMFGLNLLWFFIGVIIGMMEILIGV